MNLPHTQKFKLALAISLLACSLKAVATTYELTASDHWADRIVGNAVEGYSVKTFGSCSISGVFQTESADLEADPISTNAHVEISLGSFDTYFYLRDDPGYKPGDTSATFREIDPADGAVTELVALSWGDNVVTISVTLNYDAIDGEGMFGTPGDPGLTGIQDYQIPFYYNIGNRISYNEPYLYFNGENRDVETVDRLGNPQSLETGVVTASRELTGPRPFIDDPPVLTTISGSTDSQIRFAGTVTSVSPLASVSYYLNSDSNNPIPIIASFPQTTTSASWSVLIDLASNNDAVEGSNTLHVQVEDIYGGGAGRSRKFLWAFTNQLHLQTTGQGSVTGLKNGETLVLGKYYPVVAVPAEGCFLESWTDSAGDILSAAPSFSYVAGEDPVLVANFTTNPFVDLHGSYTGLFYDTTNGISADSAGALDITVSTGGTYSGRLILGGRSYPINGALDFSPDYATGSLWVEGGNHIIRNGVPPLQYYLQLNIDTNATEAGSGVLSGWVQTFTDFSEQQTLWNSALSVKHEFYASNEVPVGVYNIALDPVDFTAATGPGGFSYGSLAVSRTGGAGFVLNLADGTTPRLSFGSAVASDGTAPVYASLYGAQGVAMGWVNLSTNTNAISWVAWDKPSMAGKFYPDGFFANVTPSASLYIAPSRGTNLFNGTNLTVTLHGGGLSSDLTANVTFNPVKNTFSVVSPNENKLSMSFAPLTGLISGSFVPPSRKTPLTFKAVVLADESSAFGFFTGTNETGSVVVQ